MEHGFMYLYNWKRDRSCNDAKYVNIIRLFYEETNWGQRFMTCQKQHMAEQGALGSTPALQACKKYTSA